MWVARDKNGSLRLYTERPIQKETIEGYENFDWCTDMDKMVGYLPIDLFPDLRWKDEPIEVTLTEVCDVRCEQCKRGVKYDSNDVKDDETYGEWGADIIICPYCGNKICINEW